LLSVQNRGGDTIRPACCPAQATSHVWSDVRLHTTEERIGARRRTRFPLRNFSKKKRFPLRPLVARRPGRASGHGRFPSDFGPRSTETRNGGRKESRWLAGWRLGLAGQELEAAARGDAVPADRGRRGSRRAIFLVRPACRAGARRPHAGAVRVYGGAKPV